MGAQDVDYRRFFDIQTLVGLRVEDPDVFEESHRLVLRWAERGLIDGLRVDHVDGLRDPTAYLERLAQRVGGRPIWVEKILERSETLPAPGRSPGPPGTTPERWFRTCCSTLTVRTLTRLWLAMSDDDTGWDALTVAARLDLLDTALVPPTSRASPRRWWRSARPTAASATSPGPR